MTFPQLVQLNRARVIRNQKRLNEDAETRRNYIFNLAVENNLSIEDSFARIRESSASLEFKDIPISLFDDQNCTLQNAINFVLFEHLVETIEAEKKPKQPAKTRPQTKS